MATHSSVLAWRILVIGEPGGLPSLESHSRTRLKRLSSNLAAKVSKFVSCYNTLFKIASFQPNMVKVAKKHIQGEM